MPLHGALAAVRRRGAGGQAVKVLVTGGAGFIGSHIVERLLDGGAEVRVLDRREPLDLDPRVELVVGDLADDGVAGRAVVGVEAICHQAAKVGLGVSFEDVDGYVADNDVATAALLKALWRRSFAGRLVLASSMVVYGEGLARCPAHGRVVPAPRRADDLSAGRWEPPCPIDGCDRDLGWTAVGEDTAPSPRNVYAATKLHQEHLCAVWARETGATLVALRYHNVYGPRMPRDTPYAGVAAIFRSALSNGQPARVREDGRQTRDFVHVTDVARANVLALTAPRAAAGVYNIASGAPHNVRELADALARSLGRNGAVEVTGEWRAGDVRHIVASPRRAADALGFVAEVSFDAGMAEFAGAPPPVAAAR